MYRLSSASNPLLCEPSRNMSSFYLPGNFCLAALPRFSMAAAPFGHLSPEGTVIFLNGFHFVSGNVSQEISANNYCSTVMSKDRINRDRDMDILSK